MASAPIVILGAARSGTKFLRDVLAAAPEARAVPYDVPYVWRYRAAQAHDALEPDSLTPARITFIRRQLHRLAGLREGDGILIEKTVGNTLRVPFVAQVLPEARFVHLVRDGRDVTESAMRQWHAPPDWPALWTKLRGMPLSNAGYALWFGANFLKGLASGRGGGKVWGPRYPGIAEDAATLALARVCARQWRHSVETATQNLAALTPDRVHHIRYEDLTGGPEALSKLIAGLDLPAPEKILARYSESIKNASPRLWQTRMSPEDQEHMWDEISQTLGTLGYTT